MDSEVHSSRRAETGAAAPNLVLRGNDGGEIGVLDLARDTLLLLFCRDSERTWLDAIGYVNMMSTTRVSGIPVWRGEESDVIAGYGLCDGAAVLVQPGGVLSAVLPGADPYQELIRAVAARTT
jgi:hypothetical protein